MGTSSGKRVSASPYSDASELPGLSSDGDEPVFANPWQAKIFALVVGLHQRGCFSWTEWTEILSTEIAVARANGENDNNNANKAEPDPGDSYYRMWVIALERLLMNKTIVYSGDIPNRVKEWRNAYLNTSHGNPVTLSRADD